MLPPVLPFLFKRKSERGWLVIQIGPGTVRLAHVYPNGGRPKVLFCEERQWVPDEPKTLEKICREFHVDRFQCTTLLDPGEYQILAVEAPNVRPDELKAAVRWRIKDLIDYHLEDAVVDVLDIPPGNGGGTRSHSMYAVAARSEIVRGVIDRFESAGVPLQVIDIPDTAQRNLAAHLEPEGKGVVMVSFDDRGGLITFTAGGELYLTRRIDIPAAGIGDADEEKRIQFIDRAALEIQRSLDHFERQFHYVAIDRVLVAPVAGAPDLIERIAANVFLPVEAFRLEAALDISEAPALADAGLQPRWLKMVGAGLRVEPRAL